MLSCQSLNPNICRRASRSGWMGEAKRRSVGDRKRAESPTEGHNTLFCFFARRVIDATPTNNTLRYQTKTHTCDRPLRGRDRGDQQSAQGGSLHTPTTDHSTQLITAHAHDHHSSYSSRARVAIAMRLMFSGASSNHLVFVESIGAVSLVCVRWWSAASDVYKRQHPPRARCSSANIWVQTLTGKH